jgi:nucleotide-binding universal stress UspA family protein
MIKDVMVRLDGSAADDMRLSVAKDVAETFDGQLVALFINELPHVVPDEGIAIGDSVELITQAREAGDAIEAKLNDRLSQIRKRFELRRFDVFTDIVPDIAAREARSADAFVALRPNGGGDDAARVVEGVLFGSGHHLLLIPQQTPDLHGFDHIFIAWNGSRESARALSEAIPYLHRAKHVSVVSVVEEHDIEQEAVLGEDAVLHLAHHGIHAALRHVPLRNRDVAATLLAEAQRRDADLIVLGGYGHSRVREWFLGGVTHTLMHQSPVPLLLAH